MLPDQVSNPGPLTYESDALPIALRRPAVKEVRNEFPFSNVYRSVIYTGSHAK